MIINSRFKTNLKIQFKKNKLTKFCIITLTIIFLGAVFAFLSPYNPNQIDISAKLQGPSLKHFFGTDELGRDYFTRALYGARVSLTIGIFSMLVSVTIGTLVGAISGYMGGKVDAIIMRSIDILMAIPVFFLILIVNAYLRPSFINIILIIGIFSWMGIARLVRSETLSLKKRDFVLCSKSLGASNWYIIRKHIISNISSTVIVASTINIADAILMESVLSFLGLGVQQPMASWGSMLQAAQTRMSEQAYLAVFPGVLILLTVLSFNALGDVLRTALEPKINDL